MGHSGDHEREDAPLGKKLKELYGLIDGIEIAMFTTRRRDGRLTLTVQEVTESKLTLCLEGSARLHQAVTHEVGDGNPKAHASKPAAAVQQRQQKQGRSSTTASAQPPQAMNWMGHIVVGWPRGHFGPVRRRAVDDVVFRNAWDPARSAGGSAPIRRRG